MEENACVLCDFPGVEGTKGRVVGESSSLARSPCSSLSCQLCSVVWEASDVCFAFITTSLRSGLDPVYLTLLLFILFFHIFNVTSFLRLCLQVLGLSLSLPDTLQTAAEIPLFGAYARTKPAQSTFNTAQSEALNNTVFIGTKIHGFFLLSHNVALHIITLLAHFSFL